MVYHNGENTHPTFYITTYTYKARGIDDGHFGC
jgi:hypothetical protein